MKMYKKWAIGIIAAAVLCCVQLVQAQVVDVEHIEQFNTAIAIQKDSSMDVSETIQYVFPTGEVRHGIYRTIPLKGLYLSQLSVTDDHGAPYKFVTSRSGGNETIKIGDADEAVAGTKTYVISYHVEGAIADQKDQDELYWNTTGNEWDYPILHTHQSISFPEVVSKDKLNISCYQGVSGTNTPSAFSTLATNLAGTTQIDFVQSQPLKAAEGITIAIGFPKGIIMQPTAFQKFLIALKHTIPLILSVLLFLGTSVYAVWKWLKHGRDPKGTGVIIAQYDVPDNFHPTEVAGLLHKKIGNADVSAELILLAVHGFITIEKIETKKFFISTGDYRLTLLKDSSEAIDDIDSKLLAGLFGAGAEKGKTVLLSDLKGSFYTTVAGMKKGAMQALTAGQYFAKNPDSIHKKAVGIIAIGIVAGLFLIGIAPFVIVFVFLAVLVVGIFMYLSTPRTAKGVSTKEYILGLKDYLQIAEKDRINFHNAPEKKPELFEALLPYAMVLGVEKAWAKEFEDVYLTPPQWYVDHDMRGFNTYVLLNSFSNFNSVAIASSAAPRGSGSASSGGGFSGGGFGGGGGGSW